MKLRRDLCVLAALLGLVPLLAWADETNASKPKADAGHSAHGDAFNEGPRQSAYLMGGTGNVHFPVTTKNAEAQKFFDQGVGQLHGFWYFEAERSFRQVATLDPNCAMAYWGMAMANINNRKRARDFIRKAVARAKTAGRNEQLWIETYAAFFDDGKRNNRTRYRDVVRDLEKISREFPKDLEAKTFRAFHIYDNQSHGIGIRNPQTLEDLIQEVLKVEPLHPVHHYRIHLWDGKGPAKGLTSAARCGQAAPSIAHMWHMPGHIFVKLHRYADAAWQQEASARVDHAHMMHDRVLPDQIHNYSHNNQWLVEDLEFVGRVHDAVALAKNMIELPRHPKYNTQAHGSSAEGRQRLFEVLSRFELWDAVIALGPTVYLEPTALPAQQVKRLRLLGLAYFGKGDRDQGEKQIQALEALRRPITAERIQAAEKAEEKAQQANQSRDQTARAMTTALLAYSDRLEPIDAALTELRGWSLLAKGDKAKARGLFTRAKDIPKDRLARVWLLLGDQTRALQLARENFNRGPGQVLPLAQYVDLLQRCGQPAEAQKYFQQLRPLSAFIDLDAPVMKRLAPVARELKLPADWRVKPAPAADVGQRPDLKDLGPFRWQPTPAPDWTLTDVRGRKVALRDFRGKPVLIIFFLGNGCPHCVEQLNLFQPLVTEFNKAGIKVIAVSTDSAEGLQKTFEKTKLTEEFLLLSDPELKVFKEYRAYDDFEHMPLHGTFLVDGSARVRWQDVSFEPFTEVKFLLEESKRLLSLPPATSQVRASSLKGWVAKR